MRTLKLEILVAFGAWLVISLGCNGYSAVQGHRGVSYSENVARMTENLLAGKATVPVEGMDPHTTEQVMEKYYELQRQLPSAEDDYQSIIDIDF